MLRNSITLAKRIEGIDCESVPASLAGRAVEPGDAGYGRVRSTYMRRGSPGLVLKVHNAGEVRDAVDFVRSHPGCRSECVAAGTASPVGRPMTTASSSTSRR